MALAPDIVAAIAARLANYAGLELPGWVIDSRASARMAALELPPPEYVALIQSARGGFELDELIEAVRVGESRLFRHRSQIGALVDHVVPALRATGRRQIRVWSAGCAAGQEPHTLAIVLARALPGCQVSIVATDVSADALEVARGAAYPVAALNDVPQEWRDAFVIDDDLVRVRDEIAALVRFERANLVDGFAPRNCDLVWCRNVLIYFTPPARLMAIQRLVAATNPGGFLFVGYSESLRDIGELDAVRAGDSVYYRRREAGEPAPPRTTTSESPSGEASRRRTPAAGILVVHGITRTPSSGMPVIIADPTDPGAQPLPADESHTPPPMMLPEMPPPEDLLVLRGHPDARTLIADITARLSLSGLERLVIDLDRCELLGDDLAPVFRRARAAARAAGVELVLRTTRAGARRWLARHELEEDK